jgi:hypothetical protein
MIEQNAFGTWVMTCDQCGYECRGAASYSLDDVKYYLLQRRWKPLGGRWLCADCKLKEQDVKPAPSAVDHPPHYNVGQIEVIDAIEDWKLGFHLGNVVKYVARAGHKGKRLEDLKKGLWYLQREIDNLEREQTDP